MIPDSTRVRVANREDLEGVFRVSRAVHGENGVGAFDDDRVRARIETAVRGENAICGVIGPAHEIQGAVLLEITQHWYSTDWFVSERFLCVLPEFRRSTNAKDLLAFAKGVSDKLGLPLFCGVMSPNNIERKTIFYKKSLGPASGVMWIYPPGVA